MNRANRMANIWGELSCNRGMDHMGWWLGSWQTDKDKRSCRLVESWWTTNGDGWYDDALNEVTSETGKKKENTWRWGKHRYSASNMLQATEDTCSCGHKTAITPSMAMILYDGYDMYVRNRATTLFSRFRGVTHGVVTSFTTHWRMFARSTRRAFYHISFRE